MESKKTASSGGHRLCRCPTNCLHCLETLWSDHVVLALGAVTFVDQPSDRRSAYDHDCVVE